MMSFRAARAVAIAVALALMGATGLAPGAGAKPAEEAVSVWKVFVADDADEALVLNGDFDLVESRGDDHLLVVGEDAVAVELRGLGLTVTRDRVLNPLPGVLRQAQADGTTTNLAALYYGGYRTVDEHYAHLDSVAAAHPGLATVHDYGDSWRKVQGLSNPNDLKVICITAKQPGDCALDPGSAKPRAVIMAAIHARELQTSELAWRLIDELTGGYGVDADITHMLDTTEVWVIPVVNPDGREIVEGGGNRPYLQRKNANATQGNCAVPPTSSNHHGVDLNRNASTFNYGGAGTTVSPCAQTFRGTGPASEPEQASLEALFTQLWPDQKGAPSSPVATSSTGTFITLHSYGDLVLLPPGDGPLTPNDAQLRALAFRMSHFNNYETGTGPETLYGTTGTTDDWVHYTLGVAGFTFEVSPDSGTCSGFTPAYGCIDSVLWPLNRSALLYAIKVAGAPYVTPRGPTTTSVAAPTSVAAGSPLALSAVVNDNAYGNRGVSRPTARTVTAAEYYLDVAPGAGGTPVALGAADGSFNQTSETVSGSIATGGLAPGQHTVYVRGRNIDGFWGPITAASFTVTTGGGGGTDPEVVFDDDLEASTGWVTNPNGTDTATTGQWERGDPQTTTSSGTKQQGTTTSGTFNLVTGAAAGSSAGAFDIDGGTTSIQSPLITLPSSGTLTLTFQFYLAHGTNSSTADFFRAFIVVGSTATQVFEELGAANDDDAAFTLGTVNLSSFAGQTIRIRFDAADASTASLVEAGLDDVRITRQ